MATLWDELLFMTQQLRGRVLDAGCGPGVYSKRLHEILGITEVISFDIQPPDTDYNGQRFCDLCPSGTFVQGDLEDMHMFSRATYDAVFAWQVLEHTANPLQALREMRRVLKSGGLFAVSELFPDPDYPWKSTTVKLGNGAGFVVNKVSGNFFNYTVRFRKP